MTPPHPTDALPRPDLDRTRRTPSARPTPRDEARDEARSAPRDDARVDRGDDPVMDTVARVIGFGAFAALFLFVVLGTLGRL